MLKTGLKAAFTFAVGMGAYVGYMALSQTSIEPALNAMNSGTLQTSAYTGLFFTQLAAPFVAGFATYKALKRVPA